MKNLKKILLSLAMVGVMCLGFSQLSMAASGSCPAYHCDELVTCDVSLNVLGTCNGASYYIYPVESCYVTTCYANYEF